jgi:hypothetical protein
LALAGVARWAEITADIVDSNAGHSSISTVS